MSTSTLAQVVARKKKKKKRKSRKGNRSWFIFSVHVLIYVQGLESVAKHNFRAELVYHAHGINQ
jgi:hypothetical protein